jgi:nucleoid-associated protein YgaU
MSSTDKPDFSKVKGTVRSTSGDIPDFSKVEGSVRSEADARTHTVEKGDTLSHIAKTYYGRASRWHAIFDANRDVLDDPDKIQPGQVLKIPAIDTDDDAPH